MRASFAPTESSPSCGCHISGHQLAPSVRGPGLRQSLSSASACHALSVSLSPHISGRSPRSPRSPHTRTRTHTARLCQYHPSCDDGTARPLAAPSTKGMRDCSRATIACSRCVVGGALLHAVGRLRRKHDTPRLFYARTSTLNAPCQLPSDAIARPCVVSRARRFTRW